MVSLLTLGSPCWVIFGACAPAEMPAMRTRNAVRRSIGSFWMRKSGGDCRPASAATRVCSPNGDGARRRPRVCGPPLAPAIGTGASGTDSHHPESDAVPIPRKSGRNDFPVRLHDDRLGTIVPAEEIDGHFASGSKGRVEYPTRRIAHEPEVRSAEQRRPSGDDDLAIRLKRNRLCRIALRGNGGRGNASIAKRCVECAIRGEAREKHVEN